MMMPMAGRHRDGARSIHSRSASASACRGGGLSGWRATARLQRRKQVLHERCERLLRILRGGATEVDIALPSDAVEAPICESAALIAEANLLLPEADETRPPSLSLSQVGEVGLTGDDEEAWMAAIADKLEVRGLIDMGGP
jgi:hypothetical protein